MIESVWAGATTLASPALRVWLRYRVSLGKEVGSRLVERRGVDAGPRPPGRLIWVHAASVGETLSIVPVVEALTELAADLTILLTTGTLTSAELLGQRLSSTGLEKRVLHRFAPLDVPSWVGRFLDHWRPAAVAFVESELWPNTLGACRARGIPAVLVNARMSARSYASWSRFPFAARPIIDGFQQIRARSEEDAKRLRALGATRVAVKGDLKFAARALPLDPIISRVMHQRLAGRPVFVAASTHPGEEALIRDVHAALISSHSDLLTIVAPRHPERGPELAELLGAPRRQLGQPPPPKGGVWIADTLGELGLWYQLGHVVFLGRSLIAPGGGQNPLEPARLGRAIAVGPNTGNFTDHVNMLRAAGALEVAGDVQALIRFTGEMLDHPEARQLMGERARAAAEGPETLVRNTASALLRLIAPA